MAVIKKVRKNIALLRKELLLKRIGRAEMVKLFELQDQLIEHKFPYDFIAIHEYLISCAGDIYREMTHKHPWYPYIDEKWSMLTKYCYRSGGLTWGDYILYERLMHEPYYESKRRQFMEGLQSLKEQTRSTVMDEKRKRVMMKSLEMIEGLIKWFESLHPPPPHTELDELTGAIADYFPEDFYRNLV